MEPAVEARVHLEMVLAGGGQAAGQQAVDQPPVAGPRDTVQAQFDRCVPALEGRLGPLAVQVPEREAVHAAGRDRDGRELLLRPGKVKHLPDGGGLVYVAGSLALGVVLQVTLLVQLVAEVSGSLDPRVEYWSIGWNIGL